MVHRRELVVLVACLAGSAATVAARTPSPATPRAAVSDRTRAGALPPAILAAFRATYPAATITHVQKGREHGTVVREVESTDGGRGRDLLYDLHGTVVELEEGIPVVELPAAVSDAVSRRYPKAVIVKAEKVTRGRAVSYELELKGASVRTLQLTPEGTPTSSTTAASQ